MALTPWIPNSGLCNLFYKHFATLTSAERLLVQAVEDPTAGTPITLCSDLAAVPADNAAKLASANAFLTPWNALSSGCTTIACRHTVADTNFLGKVLEVTVNTKVMCHGTTKYTQAVLPLTTATEYPKDIIDMSIYECKKEALALTPSGDLGFSASIDCSAVLATEKVESLADWAGFCDLIYSY